MPEPIIQIQRMYPPVGLITQCPKPKVVGISPEETTEDVLRLKSALSKCAGQADDYLNWRKNETN